MPALTRDEAQTRARLLDVHRYVIDLDLTHGPEHFVSRTAVRFSARTPGDTFIDIAPHELRSATLDGRPLDPATLDGNRLPLTGLTEGDHELRLEATMPYSRTGEGMHRFTDPADGETYVYTQLFLDNAQRVFAAFDQPDLKAVFDLSVTAPGGWTVLGNSTATRQDGEANHVVLAPTPPISTYLVAVAAGPWHTVRTEHAGLPFGIHCRSSLAPHLTTDAEEIFDITRRCYDRYHTLFDEPYPFDSYDQAFVPEFNAGAMENPGLVTFREEFVFRSAVTHTERQTRGLVIAHEMAHMWFGDLVTLRWWDDIWLNESFAEYMSYQVLSEATGYTDTWTDFGIARKGWGSDADQRPSTHPVAPADVPDTDSALLNFDGISYAKGASALRQLVAWMGEKDFLAGVNDHITRHRFGNATLADFVDSLAQATDRDVHAWAENWLRTTGIDTLTPVVGTAPGGGWTLRVDRDGSRPHHLTAGLYDRDPTDPTRLVARDHLTWDIPAATSQDPGTATAADAPGTSAAPGAPGATRAAGTNSTGARDGAPQRLHTAPGPRPALVLLNDGDLTYTKVRLDPTSWDTVRTALSGLPDALTRAVAWNAARDMVRDGELHPTAYLDTARAHLPYETDIAIVSGALAFARAQIADRYLPAADRPAALNTLSTIARDILRRTEGSENGDGQGLRLAAVRTFIDSATTPDGIQDWLSGGSVPGGPALDPELRWRILGRLAVLGATTPAAIEDELARDPSATGRQGAATCHAALPDPAAKQAAWDALFATDEHTDLSNYLFNATAVGFWAPEQLDLVRPYVTRYFPAAVALAARRGPALADSAGRYAFPTPLVDTATLQLGEECLRTADPSPALRRKLIDQLDDLRRALRVRGE